MKYARPLAAAAFLAALSTPVARAQTAPSASPSPSASPAAVQDPCGSILSIVTRPTVTTSVCTVRPQRMDVETGYTNTVTTGMGGFNTADYPQTFLRFGSGDPHFEYDLLPPSVNVVNAGGTSSRGATDMGLGLKAELGYNAKASWGVSALATLPSGSPGFTAGGATYAGSFNWSYAVNQIAGVAGALSFNSLAGYDPNGNLHRFFSLVPSLELTAAWPADSEFFVEYAYFSQAGAGLSGKSLIDYGFIHDFGPHVQIDIECGVQPTTINGQRQHYVGAGLSFMN